MKPSDKVFDKTRRSGGMQVRRKYLLAFEGYRTEVQYFEGVADNKSLLNISSLIEICPLCRFPFHSGHSDPLSVVHLLGDYVKLLENGRYSRDLFASSFLDSALSEDEAFAEQDKIQGFFEMIRKELEDTIDENDTDAIRICKDLFKNIFGRDAGDTVIPERIDFRKDRDKICVIIDRDKDSRGSSRCSDMISECNKKGYDVYISNPCFEMWLLMHYDDVLAMNRKTLLNNPKKDGKRFTEAELDRILAKFGEGYDKNNLIFYRFAHRVDDAIKNSRTFCNELKCIKTKVGTNIGMLIESMRKAP